MHPRPAESPSLALPRGVGTVACPVTRTQKYSRLGDTCMLLRARVADPDRDICYIGNLKCRVRRAFGQMCLEKSQLSGLTSPDETLWRGGEITTLRMHLYTMLSCMLMRHEWFIISRLGSSIDEIERLCITVTTCTIHLIRLDVQTWITWIFVWTLKSGFRSRRTSVSVWKQRQLLSYVKLRYRTQRDSLNRCMYI
jgi:hypothetical protein